VNSLAAIFPRLCNSLRGEIFLCNLEAALRVVPPILDAGALRQDLQIELTQDIRFDDEDTLLGYLRDALAKAPSGQWRGRCTSGLPAGFSRDGYVVTVMTMTDYESYYDRPSISGHAFDSIPGSRATDFRPSACTREYFWAAPKEACPDDAGVDRSADTLRDRLGLVQHGSGVSLVALYIKVPIGHTCCRPSVIEANPNARFRQVHPDRSETAWGYTVHLDKLPGTPVGETIAGAPEILVSKLRLADPSLDVLFVSLGVTRSDKATANADRAFRDHLRLNREFGDIYRNIRGQLDFDI
jgi:hypothetical protein